MKIYISGAITNNSNYRNQFKQAEDYLRSLGHVVLNPVKNEGFTYREYIDMSLMELSKCDAIFMLDGWEISDGAKLEHHYASAVNMLIIAGDKNNEILNVK